MENFRRLALYVYTSAPQKQKDENDKKGHKKWWHIGQRKYHPTNSSLSELQSDSKRKYVDSTEAIKEDDDYILISYFNDKEDTDIYGDKNNLQIEDHFKMSNQSLRQSDKQLSNEANDLEVDKFLKRSKIQEDDDLSNDNYQSYNFHRNSPQENTNNINASIHNETHIRKRKYSTNNKYKRFHGNSYIYDEECKNTKGFKPQKRPKYVKEPQHRKSIDKYRQ